MLTLKMVKSDTKIIISLLLPRFNLTPCFHLFPSFKLLEFKTSYSSAQKISIPDLLFLFFSVFFGGKKAEILSKSVRSFAGEKNRSFSTTLYFDMTDICEQSHTLFHTLSLLNTHTHTVSYTHFLAHTYTHTFSYSSANVLIYYYMDTMCGPNSSSVSMRERESCLFIICYCLLFKHNRESLNDIVEEEEGTCFVLF